MKQLRFVALLTLIVFLIVLLSPSSSGQASQPATPQTPAMSQSPTSPSAVAQNPAPQTATTGASQASPANPAGALSQRHIKVKLVPRRFQPGPKPLKPLPDTPLVPGVFVQRLADLTNFGEPVISHNAASNQRPDRSFDSGIYLRQAGDSGACGSIVSYNFSQEANPQLESVTTCTPLDDVATRRAQGKGKKPSIPHFQLLKYSTPPQ